MNWCYLSMKILYWEHVYHTKNRLATLELWWYSHNWIASWPISKRPQVISPGSLPVTEDNQLLPAVVVQASRTGPRDVLSSWCSRIWLAGEWKRGENLIWLNDSTWFLFKASSTQLGHQEEGLEKCGQGVEPTCINHKCSVHHEIPVSLLHEVPVYILCEIPVSLLHAIPVYILREIPVSLLREFPVSLLHVIPHIHVVFISFPNQLIRYLMLRYCWPVFNFITAPQYIVLYTLCEILQLPMHINNSILWHIR